MIADLLRVPNGEPATRVDSPGQLAAVSVALGLSAEESRVLELLSEWEGQSPREYCQTGLVGYLEASFGDMDSFARMTDGKRAVEREWALQFFPRVKSYFDKNGNLLETDGTAAPRRGQRGAATPGGVKGKL